MVRLEEGFLVQSLHNKSGGRDQFVRKFLLRRVNSSPSIFYSRERNFGRPHIHLPTLHQHELLLQQAPGLDFLVTIRHLKGYSPDNGDLYAGVGPSVLRCY